MKILKAIRFNLNKNPETNHLLISFIIRIHFLIFFSYEKLRAFKNDYKNHKTLFRYFQRFDKMQHTYCQVFNSIFNF